MTHSSRSAPQQQKLRAMISSYGQSLADNPALCREVRTYTSDILDLAPTK